MDEHRGQEPGHPSGGPLFEHSVPKDTEIEVFSALCVLPNSALNPVVHGQNCRPLKEDNGVGMGLSAS